MRSLLAFFIIIGFSLHAKASALASLWNGEHINLSGQILVQDAEQPLDFYVLPSKYILKRESKMDPQTGQLVNTVWFQNRVVDQGGVKYSVYTFKLELDSPGRMELLRAENKLRSITKTKARIKGLAPICGVALGSNFASFATPTPQVDPEATLISYSIKSTEADQCKSVLGTSDFAIEIKVPMSREPEVASQLISMTGLVLPALELVHPYKIKNSIVMTFNPVVLFEQMQTNVGLTGTWKFITASVQSNSTKMMKSLELTGGLTVNWEGADQAIRDIFINKAIEFLSQSYLKYSQTSQKDLNSKPETVADKNQSVSTSLFRVDMAMTKEAATIKEKISLDFSSVTYGTVKSQAQIEISNITSDQLDPEVRKLLGE